MRKGWKWDNSLKSTTYGFDLTPLLFLAWSTGDKQWLDTLTRRYNKDRELFPDFYKYEKGN